MDKAGNDLVEAVKVVKEALDESKIEAYNQYRVKDRRSCRISNKNS